VERRILHTGETGQVIRPKKEASRCAAKAKKAKRKGYEKEAKYGGTNLVCRFLSLILLHGVGTGATLSSLLGGVRTERIRFYHAA